MLPRLIATDLDGTLLNSQGVVSERSIAALRAAHAAGIIVVFATGRPPFVAAQEVLAVGPAVAYGVMANGSMICTLPNGDSLYTIRFPSALAVEAIGKLRAHDPLYHDHSALELLDIIPPIVGAELVVSHIGTEAVELGPPGADKGAGLRWLCAHLGIDGADVMVFGDEINDLAMFDFAGHSVAVGNAAPLVRAAATEVTASNDDDGVALVIEAMLAVR